MFQAHGRQKGKQHHFDTMRDAESVDISIFIKGPPTEMVRNATLKNSGGRILPK